MHRSIVAAVIMKTCGDPGRHCANAKSGGVAGGGDDRAWGSTGRSRSVLFLLFFLPASFLLGVRVGG